MSLPSRWIVPLIAINRSLFLVNVAFVNDGTMSLFHKSKIRLLWLLSSSWSKRSKRVLTGYFWWGFKPWWSSEQVPLLHSQLIKDPTLSVLGAKNLSCRTQPRLYSGLFNGRVRSYRAPAAPFPGFAKMEYSVLGMSYSYRRLYRPNGQLRI